MSATDYKSYLGDDIFADFDGNNIVLGYRDEERILLPPHIMDALARYCDWLQTKIQEGIKDA